MKKILIVSPCTKRRDTLGLVSDIISTFAQLDETKYNISLFDTSFFERNHNPKDYDVDNYWGVDKHCFDGIMRRIPHFRAKYARRVAIKTYRRLLKEQHYDIVVVHQVPNFADELVTIAHNIGAKIIFEPFGSDVLLATGKDKKNIENAFKEVDGVVGRKKSNVLIAAQEIYKVPDNKIFEQREVLGGVIRLKNLRGKLSRLEMHREIGLPYSDYNIVCGYSGRKTHKHRQIIDALIQVKDVLPEGYQIIFPMTYGAGAHHEIIIDYAAGLKSVCDKAGLNTVFMTEYKTYEQMAFLHLITDLFIEIQPTDNGNAFMIEALYAQNQIVTGRWLNYQRFEQFGAPYYLIDKPEELAENLRDIFTGKIEKVQVPQKLIDFFDVPDGYDRSTFWSALFETL